MLVIRAGDRKPGLPISGFLMKEHVEFTTVRRQLEWDAGHRVLGHEGKCKHIHGHRYMAMIVCSALKLDKLGMVIDFGKIKEKVGGWIDHNWDHNILLNSEDPLVPKNLLLNFGEDEKKYEKNVVEALFAGKTPYLFQGRNPTAEVIAKELYMISAVLLCTDDIAVREVVVFETPNCSASFCLMESNSHVQPEHAGAGEGGVPPGRDG